MLRAMSIVVQVDIHEAAKEGQMTVVQLVCTYCPERLHELDKVRLLRA